MSKRIRPLRMTLAAGLALAWALLVGVPAQAATFTVTKTADTADGACNADCSLREAIIAANAAAGTDTIVVPAGTYLLTINTAGAQDDTSAEGDLDITETVTLTGAGPSQTTVDGNGTVLEDHVFQIKGPAQATISGLTVRGGNATDAGAGTRDDGGGIFVDEDPSVATLFLSDTLVTGNHADDFSGGVDVDGNATLTNVTISGNTADGGAGGIEVEGTATLTNVTVSENSAAEEGGGIGMFGDSLTINNSTVTGNTTDDDNNDDADGGGLFVDSSGLVIRNTIIAGNTDASSPGTVHPDCSTADPAFLTSQGHNLIGLTPGGCPFTGPGDLTGVNPLLGPLADNGGPTTTHALLTGSPAINAGDPATPGSGGTACAATDQRGASRNCDIGAYELVQCQGVTVNRVGAPAGGALTGTDAADGFLGGPGPDTATGLGGDDAFCLEAGDDTASGGAGNDKILGGTGNDTGDGGDGDDSFTGGDGDDTGTGGAGNDQILGEAGNDTGDGGEGNDTFLGGVGNDLGKGAGGKDLLKGEAGKDKLNGGGGKDKLLGGGGKDKLNCGGGKNEVGKGGPGKDRSAKCEKGKA